MKRNMILKETIILITQAGLANWNKKHKGKKENGNREVPSLFSSWHLSAHCPILFHLTLVCRLNLNWKQYMMVLQKKGNTLENPKKSKNNQRYEQKQLTHFFNDKAQTSSSVSNGTIATTGPMDKN